jgi:hypothetical protein
MDHDRKGTDDEGGNKCLSAQEQLVTQDSRLGVGMKRYARLKIALKQMRQT